MTRLAKPPQRRHYTDPRPLLLIVCPLQPFDLSSLTVWLEHSILLLISLVIFWYTILSPKKFVYQFLWLLRFCLLMVRGCYIGDYLQILQCVFLFIIPRLRLKGRLGSRKPVDLYQFGLSRYSNRPEVVPQSLHVIEPSGSVFVLSLWLSCFVTVDDILSYDRVNFLFFAILLIQNVDCVFGFSD